MTLLANKKGMELSLTVLVLIILTVIIFIGGIAFVWKLFAGAEEIKAGIDLNTQRQIEALLRDSNELVAIPVNTKATNPGKEVTFGLGIKNIQSTRGYFILTSFSDLYDLQGKLVDGSEKEHIEERWLGAFQHQGPIDVGKNKDAVVPLRIRAATTIAEEQPTPRGSIAAFNVCVTDAELTEGTDCAPGIPPETLYGNKIRQVFVEIR
jgi:hypothetical protein